MGGTLPENHAPGAAQPGGRGARYGHTVGLGPGTWPFVDRDDRLRAVIELLDGDAARAVVLSGPAGSGRTRLAQESVARLRASGRRVEWVTGTRGAAAVPLSALAHVIPVVPAGADPAAAWQALAHTLDGTAAGARPVICVDDAHLLDDQSAALVHRMVLTELADVVTTVLLGAPAPDLVQALWRDGLASRLDLHTPSREHVRRMLERALDGALASRTVEELWRQSGANVVLLHELVDAGRESGALRREDDLWWWDGDPVWTERLSEAVRAQMGELGDEERTALELLALGGCLGLQDLVAMTSAAVVTGLERRGLVRVEAAVRPVAVRLAESLHAQALCIQMPQAVAGTFRDRIAETGSVQRWAREDPVRIGAFLLQLQGPPRDADVLTRAAVQANARSDHGKAESLARAALEEDQRPRAWTALAEALRWQGRPDEADHACAEAARLPMPASVRDDSTIVRMLNLFYGLGRPDEALAISEDGDGSPGTDEPLASTVARMLRLSAGDPLEEVAPPDDGPREHPAASSAAMLRSVLRTLALALTGRTDEALRTAARTWSPLDECLEDAESVSARAALMLGELTALELGGRIPEAVGRAAELHAETMERTASCLDALAALGCGSATLAAGRLSEARGWLDEAATGLRFSDPLGYLSLATSKRAQVRLLLGDLDGAALALSTARSSPAVRVHEPEVLLAEAWSAALAGRDREAAALAARAAETAGAMGHHAVEAKALDACARLGLARRVAGRLDELAGDTGGRLLTAYAAHAAAAALQRADALEEVAAEFLELGALALAADTYARAAEAHRHAGHRRRAAAAGARSTGLARAAGGLRTPTLDRLAPYALTSREREIARLAATGIPNRTIARRLVLSVRTVETHLAHAYDKLGINSRAALETALAQDDAPLPRSGSTDVRPAAPRTSGRT